MRIAYTNHQGAWMKDAIHFLDRIEGDGYGGTADYEAARRTVLDAAAEIERLRAALRAVRLDLEGDHTQFARMHAGGLIKVIDAALSRVGQ